MVRPAGLVGIWYAWRRPSPSAVAARSGYVKCIPLLLVWSHIPPFLATRRHPAYPHTYLSSCQVASLTTRSLPFAVLPQSLGKLKEPRALVRCREVDVDAVKAAIPQAKTRFSQEFGTPAPEVSPAGTWLISEATGVACVRGSD